MTLTSRLHFSSLLKICALLAAVLMPVSLIAQETVKPELTDKVSESLQAIGLKLVGDSAQGIAPDYDGAIYDINVLLAQCKPESFDTAYLSQMLAQAYIGKLDYVGSVPHLETAYRLSRAYKFFEPTAELGLLWMIAQLYVQDASLEKNSELQKQKFTKALSTVREWLALTPKPTFEAYYFAATILFQQATDSGNAKEPNKDILKQAETETLNALTLAATPRLRDQAYQLLGAIAQMNNDLASVAKYLEVLVISNPKSSSNWLTLLASYLGSADGLPDGSFLRNDAFAKAVYTISRAQENGFMNTPMDYQRLFACYYNSGQYEGAIDVLEKNIRSGKIENNQKNWEILSSCYVQINQNQKAIDTLVEASKLFKDQGNIDMQIGYLYYGTEQYQKALDSMKVARDKGVAENKRASLLFFIGYMHFELKELDEALVSVNKSLEIDDKGQNARDLQRAITESIAERERNLNRNQPAAAPAADNASQTQPQGA